MTTTAGALSAQVGARRRTKFFFGFAIAMLVFVVVGFARTFYLRPLFGAIDVFPGSSALPRHLVLHGTLMTAWFVLVAAQTFLVSRGNVALHRRIGKLGALLAVFVAGMGMFTVAELLARQGAADITTAERQNGIAIGDTIAVMLYFVPLVAAGLYFRRNFETHKRLMLVSCIVMLGPVIARFSALFSMTGLPSYLLVFVSPIPLLVALLVYDFVALKRPHWVTLLGAGLVAAYIPLRSWLLSTVAAHAYIEWLRDAV